MIPAEQMKRVRPDAELWAALEEMDRDGVNQLPVMMDGQIQGMLSREDVDQLSAHLAGIGAYPAKTRGRALVVGRSARRIYEHSRIHHAYLAGLAGCRGSGPIPMKPCGRRLIAPAN